MTSWVNSSLCKFSGCLMNFSMMFSMTNLFFISLDRYMGIIFNRGKKISKRMVFLANVSSIILCGVFGSFPVVYYEVKLINKSLFNFIDNLLIFCVILRIIFRQFQYASNYTFGQKELKDGFIL